MAHKYLTVDPLSEPTSFRRYKIHEKMLSLHDSYEIKDDSDQPVFNARSKQTFAGNLLLEDMAGNGLIKIQEELLHLHRTFKILSARDGEVDRELAVIKQQFSLHGKWLIKSIYGEYKLEALGLLSHSVTLSKAGRIVAIMNRKYSNTADSYGVEIDDAEDHAFIVALMIIIHEAL